MTGGTGSEHAAEAEASVRKLYAVLLGRAPDPEGLTHHVQSLLAGGSFEELFDVFVASNEYRELESARWQTHYAPGGSLPYYLHEAPGSKHLLVTFPGVGIGRSRRQDLARLMLTEFPAHSLLVGAEDDLLLSAHGHELGAKLATDLVMDVAARLGVLARDVICYGHSYHGTCALYVGFMAGAGHIIAGAPGVRLGSIMESLLAKRAHDPALLRWIATSMRATDDWPSDKRVLDELIVRAGLGAKASTDVSVFVSPRDVYFGDSEWLASCLKRNENINLRLCLSSYIGHDEMEKPFRRFLLERVAELLPHPQRVSNSWAFGDLAPWAREEGAARQRSMIRKV